MTLAIYIAAVVAGLCAMAGAVWLFAPRETDAPRDPRDDPNRWRMP